MRVDEELSEEPAGDEQPGRAARWPNWFQPTTAEVVGLVLLLLGAATASALWWWQAAQRPEAAAVTAAGPGATDAADGQVDGPAPGAAVEGPTGVGPAEGGPGAAGTAQPPTAVTVHVSGAVATPGLVTLPAGSRAGDAVDVAGGLLTDADPAGINLARELADGDHVHVPREGEAPPAGTDASAGADPAGPIDLNAAGEAELQTLPGVGPARATAIVEHRREHGPFAVPGDLRDVAGIGEATFQRLAPLVTVR